jgi:hypothetical protein
MSYKIDPAYEKKLKQFYKGILEDITTFVDKNKRFLSTNSINGDEQSLVYYLTAFAHLFNDERIDESKKNELLDKMTKLSIMVLSQIDKKNIAISPINTSLLNSIKMTNFIQRLKDTSGGKTRRLYKKGRRSKIRNTSRLHKSKKNKKNKKNKKQLGGEHPDPKPESGCNIGDLCILCSELLVESGVKELRVLHLLQETPHIFHKECIETWRMTGNENCLKCLCCQNDVPLNDDDHDSIEILQNRYNALVERTLRNRAAVIRYHSDYGVLRYFSDAEIQELRQTHGDVGLIEIINKMMASDRTRFNWLICIIIITILALYFNGQFQ